MKKFNTTAVCIPVKHYMVDPTRRVHKIKNMVDAGEYFCICLPRQYGKTTALSALKRVLKRDNIVLYLDFQRIDHDVFENGATFAQGIARLLIDLHEFEGVQISQETVAALERLNDSEKPEMDKLFRILKRWIRREEKPVVLIIDEADSAADNQAFLDFLSQLRDGYISRETENGPAFHSVILAGMRDVTYSRKIGSGDAYDKDNSPWNIAADFDIDMSLSETGIKGMLEEYESDHHTGMDTGCIAKQIRDYTSGYPFLVSRICQLIDEKMVPERFASLCDAWTDEGITEAVKMILTENNTLFDSLIGKLHNYPKQNRQLERMLLEGERIEYLPDNEEQRQLQMYGLIVNDRNAIAVANRLFEMRLYKKYIGESPFDEELRLDALEHKPEFIMNGQLDIPLIMKRFIIRHEQIWGMPDDKEDGKRIDRFLEEEGRRRFLTYLSPIINGVGTYEIEPQTRDGRRMDVVIHYRGQRYIIELKIWHGEKRNTEGEEQILGYLDFWNLNIGYMLSFNFNRKKETGVKQVHIGNRLLYEGTV